MPFGEVRLVPGINLERTPTLLEAGYSQSQLIRFKDGLAQKYGGWQKFFASQLSGVPRDMHAWEDLNGTTHLGVGATTSLGIITSSVLRDISPQTLTSDFSPIITSTSGSKSIAITDANIANVTTYDGVYFDVPVSVGGVVLSGFYQITLITGTTSYQITAATAASNTSTLATNGVTAAGNSTLNFASVPSWVVAGMTVVDTTTSGVIAANSQVVSTTATTVVMTSAATGGGVGNGDTIAFVSIPVFTTTSGSAVISVFLASHGLAVASTIVFPIATTGNSVTISTRYPVNTVTDTNNFTITGPNQASASSSFTMNAGLAELVYYISIGPSSAQQGFGAGGFGSGGFGVGGSTTSQTGTALSPSDWTLDNWGQLLVACPINGGIYTFDPTTGITTASLVSTAPIFNGGAFVAVSQQILVCWASTATQTIGVQQDSMLVRWSDSGDFTNFVPLTTDQAGSFRIPIGSTIRGGMAVVNQNLIWTDLDLWAMTYQGQPFIWGFNKIGAGAGLICSHAAMEMRGNVYWMGPSNFYVLDGSGVRVLPCPVWDFVFQNLSASLTTKIRAYPNTPFNEATWFFPSATSSGENDSYVTFNITEPGNPWAYGTLSRSASIDQTVLGNPITATPTGIIYQQETTNDADGQPLSASFTTGYFVIGDGESFAFIDQVIPDFKWGTFGTQGAQVQLTFNVLNYPGDTPTSYGPYLVTSATEYITTRFRGRMMSVTVSSSDVGSFWRLGRIRYRFSAIGRR